MLVLTRRVGEEIVIGDGIRVRIVAVNSRGVKVGITAPVHVTVHREEVHQRLLKVEGRPGCAEQEERAVGSEE